ncbi:MAG: AAA family ATPase [Candidatus Binatia bacterium]|nr:AAA family ATPase [Candidatus Binatia bacterium]
MPHAIVKEELELLAQVRERLEARAARGDDNRNAAAERRIHTELERIREVMRSGEEDKDRSSLLEQWHHQSALLEQLRSARAVQPVNPDVPYFGHLRLREEGREWDLCLGRTSCVEGGLRIVDWRDAPIAKLFYTYRQGEDYEEEIADREREGEIVTRRMVAIERGELRRIQAPEGDFSQNPEVDGDWAHRELAAPRLAGGESAALRVQGTDAAEARLGGGGPSGRPADRHLPEITGLIDPEQYGLISRPSAGFLIVRGTAGSGKTTVALHRVAFLAYDDPRIDGPDTLVVMFSRALQKYVSHVLPSLGLHNVEPHTYRSWERGVCRRHFPRLPGKERDDTPAVVTRAKLHPLMGAALARHVERTPGRSSPEQAVEDWASVLTNRDLLLEIRDELGNDSFSNNAIDRIVEWNEKHVGTVHDFLAGEEPNAELDAEDDALLLRAWQLRVGPLQGKGRRPLRFRHIVLDEVQDFSPLEVQILLGCLDPKGSITLAGDTQQHVIENSGFTSWAEFMEHLGVDGQEVETLKINYRSSAQISKFAFDVLGDLREDDELPPSSRQGPPVEMFQFTDTGACVFFLADALQALSDAEPMATVALITPSPEISAQYYSALARSEIPRLRLIREYDFSFKAGIEITELEPVKGLEFDYVILLDVNSVHMPETPRARRGLHVAATRAIHQLWVISTDKPSPILADVL